MKKNAIIAIFSTIILSFSSALAADNLEEYRKAKDLDPGKTGICPGIYVCWDQNNDGSEECKCIAKPADW